MQSCCAAASDSSSQLRECSTILGAIVPFSNAYSAVLDGWTEYKLARQFPNLLFSVLYTHKHTLENSHSHTSPDLQTWPWSWSDLAELSFLSLNVSRILDQWSLLLHIQLRYSSITRLPTSLIPHYRRSTWLRLNFVTPTPHTQPPGWLPSYISVYKCAQTRFPQLSIFSFFLFV